VQEQPDALLIRGGTLAARCGHCNDHRVAMAAAIASVRCSGESNDSRRGCGAKIEPCVLYGF
jgi:5-enolpyruvylshikimate-3-phosphate synthase